MREENVIVTGGTGFLGRNMIRRLCAEGYRVTAVVRPESTNLAALPRQEGVIPLRCSLRELGSLRELRQRNYSAFYHFAWAGVNRDGLDNEELQRRSLEDSLAALDAAVSLGCGCFVFSGSRSEYGRQEGWFREDAPCSPLVAYGKAKLEFGRRAAQLCRGTETRYLHARIFSVYGADDHPWSLIATAIARMRKNEPMELSPCTQRWNFMEVRDLADLLLTAHRRHSALPVSDSGVFNAATRDIRPLREFVEEIYRITGSRSELRFGAYRQSEESAVSLLPDMSKTEAAFGWKQHIPFSDGIRQIVKSLEEPYA